MNKTSMLKPTILSISLLTIMASSAISPALAKISAAFPEVDQTTIKLCLTLPSLFMIPFSLMSGWLVSRISKKTVLLTGLAVYLAGGIGGGISGSIFQLLMWRALLGVGVGLIMPLSVTFITDFFEGEARTKMMGLSGSVNQLGGMLFSLAAGLLVAISWRATFGVYGLAFVTVAFVLLWLPESPQKASGASKTGKLPGEALLLAALGTLMMVIFFVVPTDIALFIQNERSVFSSEKPLFENREQLLKSLESGSMSEIMRQAFTGQGIRLSPEARIAETVPKTEWTVTDGNSKFSVKKESTVSGKPLLTIYGHGIGTGQMAGLSLALLALSGSLAGMILSRVLKIFGSSAVAFALLLMAIGYGILGSASAPWMVFLAMPFIGIAGGIMTPPLMLRNAKIVPPALRSLSVAILSSAILFGQFLSPLAMKAATAVCKFCAGYAHPGQSAAYFATAVFRFNFLAVLLLVMSTAGFFLTRKNRHDWL
ncbi:MAG: MFS transporter [Candidatus Wallbacteria bacterium]|nr:MFS transporter [Candidatus Wallbacteria bacterium]